MVVERFKHGDPLRAGERFRRLGRMLPDGVTYRASWMTSDGTACYQLMEAGDADALAPWTRRWDDLVDFEIVAVQASADFWAPSGSH
jgi:hypothetical protein